MLSEFPIDSILAQTGAFENLSAFLRGGGVFMGFILLCSLIAVAVVVQRFLSLRTEAVIPGELVRRLEQFRLRGSPAELQALAQDATGRSAPMARLTLTALEMREEDAPTVQAAVESVARQEMVGLQRGLAILEVVITIAPLLGLLGTVSGLVQVFGVFSGSGEVADPDPARIAAGIAEALYTTVGGLVVAVPVVIAHSYLSKKIETMAVRMEVLVGQLIHALHDMRRRMGAAAGATGYENVQEGAAYPSSYLS